MKKRIKIALVVATIVALPLMAAQQSKSEEKSLLVDFIEYCKTCENLRSSSILTRTTPKQHSMS